MISSDRLLEATRRSRFWILAVLGAALATTLILYAVLPRQFTAKASLSLGNDAADQRSAVWMLRRYFTSPEFASRLIEGPRKGQAGAQPEIEAWQERMRVEPSGVPNIVLVAHSAETPLLASRLVNEAVDLYQADQRASEEARGRMAALRADLAQLGGAIEQQRTIVGEGASDAAATRVLMADLGKELATAKTEAKENAAEVWPYPAAVAPTVRALRDERERLEAYRAGLSSRYGPLHPTLVAAEKELAGVDARIEDELRKLNDAKQATRAAEVRAAATQTALGQASFLVGASDAAQRRLSDLERRSDALRAEYGALVRSAREASRPPVPAQVLSHAEIPAAPSSPDWLLLLTGGALASLAGAAGVVLAHVRGSGFRNPRDLENTLGLSMIGAIPDLKAVSDSRLRGQERLHPPALLTADPGSAFGTSIRDLLGRIRDADSDGGAQAVAICSALPNEGKTTLSICLALSAASSGEKVVLVDCDGRRRAVSRAMAPHASVGLIECLKGKARIEEALVQDADSGAWFLPQSEAAGLDANAIASDAMPLLIDALRDRFDLVLLDTGPVLALAEARAVAGMVDGVLLVARWRETPVSATRLALDLLRGERAHVIGATMTLVGNA